MVLDMADDITEAIGVGPLCILGVCDAEAEFWAGPFVLGSSGFFRFLREPSFSALSNTTFAILSNSAQTPNIRFTPPFSSSAFSIDKKLTTKFINRTSDRARGSWGFCKMFPNSVTSAETG
jgi:hypothetical protein